ncbi:hypothetical protein FN846DRAFT_463964 [Sphaerosporella brunnea]|uniref:Uncharacterized protein n=1 Tax=Sphaerosporella brunnea TaxID=1250544 RepID=A0A5J5F4T1_9PEZI|nr:hypothetical protein FN846DRAFT_463964 [Sphaerosporella brunnea]
MPSGPERRCRRYGHLPSTYTQASTSCNHAITSIYMHRQFCPNKPGVSVCLRLAAVDRCHSREGATHDIKPRREFPPRLELCERGMADKPAPFRFDARDAVGVHMPEPGVGCVHMMLASCVTSLSSPFSGSLLSPYIHAPPPPQTALLDAVWVVQPIELGTMCIG